MWKKSWKRQCSIVPLPQEFFWNLYYYNNEWIFYFHARHDDDNFNLDYSRYDLNSHHTKWCLVHEIIFFNSPTDFGVLQATFWFLKWDPTSLFSKSWIKSLRVKFFCRDRHPPIDWFFENNFWWQKRWRNENIGFKLIFALDLAISDRKMKVA